MTGFDILLLGFIAGIFAKDVGPKVAGFINAKKGGPLELSIAPYIPKWTRIISHGVFTLVFLVLIIQFDAADLFTISLIIALTIMGLVPQPHRVYMKGIQAKGHFYRWEDINEIAVPRKTAVFQLKLKRKFFYNIMFSVSTNDREVLIEALKKKPVKLEIDK